MRIWGLFLGFAIASAHAQTKTPAKAPIIPPLQQSLDDAVSGKAETFSGIEKFFLSHYVTPFSYLSESELPSVWKVPSQFFAGDSIHFRWGAKRTSNPAHRDDPTFFPSPPILEAARAAGVQRRYEFYKGVAQEARARPHESDRYVENLDAYAKLLRQPSHRPERELSAKSPTQIDTETNRRFQTTYHRPRNDVLHPEDKLNYNRLRQRVEYEEDQTRIKWVKNDVNFENIKQRLLKDLDMMHAEMSLKALRMAIPPAMKFNAQNDGDPQQLVPGTIQGAVRLGVESDHGVFIPALDLASAEIRIDPETYQLKIRPAKGGSELSLRRNWELSAEAPFIGSKKTYTVRPHAATVKLHVAQAQAQDPLWILTPPRNSARTIYETMQDQRTMDHLTQAYVLVRETQNPAQLLRVLEAQAPILRRQDVDGEHVDNFSKYGENLFSRDHSKIKPLSDVRELSREIIGMQEPRKISEATVESSLMQWKVEQRHILWSRLNESPQGWLTQELRARQQKKPTFDSLFWETLRSEKIRSRLYNTWAHTKYAAKNILVAGSASLLLWHGGKAGIHKLSNIEISSPSVPEQSTPFEREPNALEQQVKRAMEKIRSMLPAGDPQRDLFNDPKSKPSGMGLEENATSHQDEKTLFTVSGKNAEKRTLLHLASLEEVQKGIAYYAYGSNIADAALVLKSSTTFNATDGYLSIPTPSGADIDFIELRDKGGKIIPRHEYRVLSTKQGFYGVSLNSGAEQTVHMNIAFRESRPVAHQLAQAASPIKAQMLSPVLPLLKEAGFGKIADRLEAEISSGALSPQEVASIVASESVYTHARTLPSHVNAEALARNPFLRYQEFTTDGILCGECDAGNALADMIFDQVYAKSPNMRSDLRSALVAEAGKVGTIGHVETELNYTSDWTTSTFRVDATPENEPDEALAKRLVERDREASGGRRAPTEETPRFAINHPATTWDDRRRRESPNRHPEMDYLPFDLRPPPGAPPSPVPQTHSPTTPTPLPTLVEKPRAPTEEDLWRARWRDKLGAELKAQERLFRGGKLKVADSPLLLPLASIASNLHSYANGNLSLEEVYKNTGGVGPYPGPEATIQHLQNTVRAQVARIEEIQRRLPNERHLLKRAPELAEAPLLEHYLNEVPKLLSAMAADRPEHMDRCSQLLNF
ncbi:MAG TPA: hypothetical protein VM901_03295 [Bdellovibrionota bacterium]|jgi:hypothetical protein|nr:hypothetical protein [Bdellovibrionota bacterium]